MKYQELRDSVTRLNAECEGKNGIPWFAAWQPLYEEVTGEFDKELSQIPESDMNYMAAANPDTLRALLADADKGEELKGFVQAFVMVLPLLAEAADIDLSETAIKFSANDKPLASISLQECIDKARAALSQGEQT